MVKARLLSKKILRPFTITYTQILIIMVMLSETFLAYLGDSRHGNDSILGDSPPTHRLHEFPHVVLRECGTSAYLILVLLAVGECR